MNRALGAGVLIFGLFLIYLVVTRKLANALAAVTAPGMVRVTNG